MEVNVPQEVICACDYWLTIPDEVAAQGKEAVKEYIYDHFNEIPAGELNPIESSFTLSEDFLDERIEEAFSYEGKIKREFKDVLKTLRGNISQAELSKRLGFSVGLIGMYESGKRKPSYEALEILADYFHVSVDRLMGRE